MYIYSSITAIQILERMIKKIFFSLLKVKENVKKLKQRATKCLVI